MRKNKDSGKATPAESVDLDAENRRLRAELTEAKRANQILRRASAFFAAELDRPSKRGHLPLAGESSASSTTTATSSESSQSCAPFQGLLHGLL
ncbi:MULTISPECIES: hypothetical protein [unclassified Brevibacterium]|uniref:hypothetical protein n=1 Tax=unclassified Brevibacterium TaxID=2614124 RepID=UPI0015E0C280|nr:MULTISPECIES: hypothetical protein [unclassified Brevibacterium]